LRGAELDERHSAHRLARELLSGRGRRNRTMYYGIGGTILLILLVLFLLGRI
jgi:hypothetical protein